MGGVLTVASGGFCGGRFLILYVDDSEIYALEVFGWWRGNGLGVGFGVGFGNGLIDSVQVTFNAT